MEHTLEILTSRTRLRLIEPTDLMAIHVLHSFPETDEFNTLGIPEDIEDTAAIIAPWMEAHRSSPIQHYTLAIEHLEDLQVIGLFGLNLGAPNYHSAEVWYKLHRDYWNVGLGTEVLARMIEFGFEELQLHRIQAGCAVDNIGSIKVMEKVGMTREGRRRQILPLKTGWSDNFEFAILESDPR